MLVFKQVSADDDHIDLLLKLNPTRHFEAFRFIKRKTIRSQLSLINNHFKTTSFGCFLDESLVAFCQLFESLNFDKIPYHSLGNFLFSPTINLDQIAFFRTKVVESIRPIIKTELLLAPMNGHFSLGATMPNDNNHPCAFQTSSFSAPLQFFFEHPIWKLYRSYYAHRTQLDSKSKILESIKNPPPEVAVRSLSRWKFHKDMKVFNHLVNEIMKNHPLFTPTSFAEDWELLSGLRWIVDPELFKFLIYKGQEVGFCFAIPNYNEIIFPEKSDLSNFWRLLKHKNKIRTARLIYSGILPKWRGKKIFKYVRNNVILSMYKKNYSSFESSYIDQDNQASLGNVASTGGKPECQFSLWAFSAESK